MAFKKKETEERSLEITRLERGMVTLRLLGTDLVMNRMNKKAREQLLLPPSRKNTAERKTVLKHDPIAEFHEAVYLCRNPESPALIHMPTGAFKKAISQAALDTPGATKTEIGRWVQVVDDDVQIFGSPHLFMSVVRTAGIAKTPDIRTRARFPVWACEIRLRYVRLGLRDQDILNLVANAGDIVGIGDGRTEKGAFNWGSFNVVSGEDPTWTRIVSQHGRSHQEQMMKFPQAFDMETEELLAWFEIEINRREKKRKSSDADEISVIASPETIIADKNLKSGKRSGNGATESIDPQ